MRVGTVWDIPYLPDTCIPGKPLNIVYHFQSYIYSKYRHPGHPVPKVGGFQNRAEGGRLAPGTVNSWNQKKKKNPVRSDFKYISAGSAKKGWLIGLYTKEKEKTRGGGLLRQVDSVLSARPS